jgi:hypothetical protein
MPIDRISNQSESEMSADHALRNAASDRSESEMSADHIPSDVDRRRV